MMGPGLKEERGWREEEEEGEAGAAAGWDCRTLLARLAGQSWPGGSTRCFPLHHRSKYSSHACTSRTMSHRQTPYTAGYTWGG